MPDTSCSHSCQFAKYDDKSQTHVCSIGITCPGPDCIFRGFHRNMAMTYIRNLDVVQQAHV
jgi:hypothetical protein